MQMTSYQSKLLKALRANGWDVVSVHSADDYWWADEFWQIRSIRKDWGRELVVVFLVDPMSADNSQKNENVWAVSVTDQMPTDRSGAEKSVVECLVLNRHFDECLRKFIDQLDEFRRNS